MEYNKKYKKGGFREGGFPIVGILKVMGVIILAIGVLLLATYLLMALWNWLMPDIFGLPALGFWQALGIFVMAKMLFGFGGGGKKGGGGQGHKKRFKSSLAQGCSMGNGFDHWKHYDQFWKEEGEAAFRAYVERTQGTGEQRP